MKVVILTGNQPRHRFFATKIAQRFDVVGLFEEVKVYNPSTGDNPEKKEMSDEEKSLWDWHFGLAKQEEEKSFGAIEKSQLLEDLTEIIPKGEINNQKYINLILEKRPDVICIYGTSLIKDFVIDQLPVMLNMHLGLSPYYRGSGTNFWPLYNEEPEYLGVTIHRIDKGIDTGPIVHQGQPPAQSNDNQHSLGNRAIVLGVGLMIQALNELESKNIQFIDQEGKGKLYQRKDFKAEHIKKLKELLDAGMMGKYKDEERERKSKMKIIK